MGFFSCCTSNSQSAEQDAEARHARIIQIYQTAKAETQQAVQAPPAYNEVVETPTICIEEKPAQLEQSRSIASSPRTSVISVPSTRLTDFMSAYTERAGGLLPDQSVIGSVRSSLAFETPPPSYYNTSSNASTRSRSRSPHSLRLFDDRPQHPTMSPQWWNQLRESTNNG